jgi:hypothetical protein
MLKKNDIETEKVLRVNFLNPAVELEIPTGKYSTFPRLSVVMEEDILI